MKKLLVLLLGVIVLLGIIGIVSATTKTFQMNEYNNPTQITINSAGETRSVYLYGQTSYAKGGSANLIGTYVLYFDMRDIVGDISGRDEAIVKEIGINFYDTNGQIYIGTFSGTVDYNGETGSCNDRYKLVGNVDLFNYNNGYLFTEEIKGRLYLEFFSDGANCASYFDLDFYGFITTTEGELNQLSGRVNTAESNINSLSSQYSSLNNRISNLENQNLNGRISLLEQWKTTVTNTIQSIQNSITSLLQWKDTTNSTIVNISKRVSTLENSTSVNMSNRVDTLENTAGLLLQWQTTTNSNINSMNETDINFLERLDVLESCVTCVTPVCNCSPDEFIGDRYCSGDDVYQMFRDYRCSQGNCVYTDTSNIKEDCPKRCNNGVCVVCIGDSDCNNNYKCVSNRCEAGIPPTAGTITPIADTYVYAMAPTANYGASSKLMIRGYGTVPARSYFRFDTSGLGSVQSAKLYVKAYSGSGTVKTDAHFVSDDTWTEAINWNNKPSYDVTALDSQFVSNDWVVWDVTNAFNLDSNGLFSVMLKYTNENEQKYNNLYSKEASSDKPYLEVTK